MDTTLPDDADAIGYDDADGVDAIETITFTSPDKPKRKPAAKVTVQLVGHDYEMHRPKDANLFFMQSAVADSANEADRWMALLNLLDSALTPRDRKHLLERACDRSDPLTAGALWEMVGKLLDRWTGNAKIPASQPVVVSAHPDTVDFAKPIRIVDEDLDLDLVCHPPKDIILGITSSAIAASASPGQQSWCISLFLDAALSKADAVYLMNRIKAPAYADDLDLGTIASIVQTLIERWYPEGGGSRSARRARAAQTRRKTKPKGRAGKPAAAPATAIQASFLDDADDDE